MSALRTSTIVIRGTTYKVSEFTGNAMIGVRKIIETDKPKMEAYVVAACCVDPKFTMIEAQALPHFVLDKLSAEAFRLSSTEGDDAKND